MYKAALSSLLIVFSTFSAMAQKEVLSYKDLQGYLPTEILGYKTAGKPEGNSFQMNGMSYSTATQEYSKDDSQLTIAIIDYNGAAQMYQASAMAWSSGMKYEDDDQKAYGVALNGMKGWLVYNKTDGEVNLILGHKDRYLININLTGGNEATAEAISKQLNLSKLP